MNFAIECENLNKRFAQFQLQNINLTFEEGSVLGLVGPNGSGKSTLLRIFVGLLNMDGGSLRVLGREMPEQQVESKRNIGYVAEDMRLYETETIAFHMDFIQSIFYGWDEVYARALLNRFELNKNQVVKTLSRGQKIKTMILLALARRPALLVFDEPTTGLDPSVRNIVLDEMMKALEDETRSIIFSSHNTLDIEQISDVIAFLYDGRIIELQNKEEFLDGWRRLRFNNKHNIDLGNLPNIRDVQQSGQLGSAIVKNFNDAVLEQFSRVGLEVNAIEPLSLEEIFLCNVHYAKGLIYKDTLI